MAASQPALVEPSVLQWARESIGLSQLAASRKIGVSDDRVAEWETGNAKPTIAQLRRAAEVYKRPLGVFFLSSPPGDFDAMRDFRRHPGTNADAWSPELHGEFRRAQTQRDYLLELAELEDEPIAADWQVPTASSADDEETAARARAQLLARAPLAMPTGSATPYEHLNAWVAALEEAGVLVLATQRGGVSTSEMRAFSLYFGSLPVIVVNGSDSARGRLFSLLHEYAHLVLHTSGLCDTVTETGPTDPDRRLEAQCNAIAAAMLMPRDAVLARPEVVERANDRTGWDYESLRSAAVPFGASAEAFLRRLVVLGRVPSSFYDTKREEFLAAYEEDEARTKSSGGNWYRNTARDLGKGYVRRVADAHNRRIIDSYTAASYLNVKVSQIARLAQEASLQVPA